MMEYLPLLKFILGLAFLMAGPTIIILWCYYRPDSFFRFLCSAISSYVENNPSLSEKVDMEVAARVREYKKNKERLSLDLISTGKENV